MKAEVPLLPSQPHTFAEWMLGASTGEGQLLLNVRCDWHFTTLWLFPPTRGTRTARAFYVLSECAIRLHGDHLMDSKSSQERVLASLMGVRESFCFSMWKNSRRFWDVEGSLRWLFPIYYLRHVITCLLKRTVFMGLCKNYGYSWVQQAHRIAEVLIRHLKPNLSVCLQFDRQLSWLLHLAISCHQTQPK